jgi:hypothetical protein
MKILILVVALLAIHCAAVKFNCVKRNCFKWPGCVASYNVKTCRCESVCERSHKECGKEPCLQNGFCYAYRNKAFGCKCINVCIDPPYCPNGYKKCLNFRDCTCKQTAVTYNLISSSEEKDKTKPRKPKTAAPTEAPYKPPADLMDLDYVD